MTTGPYRVAEVEDAGNAACTCDNCGWDGTADKVSEVGDCCLTPGDGSPVGRCPECDGLVYVNQPLRHEGNYYTTEQVKLMEDLLREATAPGGIGEHEFTRPGGWRERALKVLKPIPSPAKETKGQKGKMETEFPSFPPLEPEVKAVLEEFGFTQDASWHNDACPSFAIEGYGWQLWIDHPELAKREIAHDRFLLAKNDSDGCPDSAAPATFCVETIEELRDALAKWKADQAAAS